MSPVVRVLMALVAALLIATTAFGSVFEVLPHLKKQQKPVCNQYGDCFGYYPPTYRPWPAHCPPGSTLGPRTQPYRLPAPTPIYVPEEPAPEPAAGPVSGIIFEVMQEPVPLAPGRTPTTPR